MDIFYQCQEKDCLFIGKESEWIESEMICDDCGSHPAFQCPVCDERYDAILQWAECVLLTER